ncbi:hypothetical protein F5Y06DRAFT_143215 [Hypoxylon sp. FL0890]|nr:hypothetical protein F5Y06DRAFT_143215 [Hypoxylon sp. FL0890]
MLELDYEVMDENLEDSTSAESLSRSVWGRQAQVLAWYGSYHDYENHFQYFEGIYMLETGLPHRQVFPAMHCHESYQTQCFRLSNT